MAVVKLSWFTRHAIEELLTIKEIGLKISGEVNDLKSKYNQIVDHYQKGLKDLTKKNMELDDKNSRINQMEVELLHLQDTVAIQKEKIISLTKDDTELSHYRNSSNSINSIELNNEMSVDQSEEQHQVDANESENRGREQRLA